jgi:hypothetical protein
MLMTLAPMLAANARAATVFSVGEIYHWVQKLNAMHASLDSQPSALTRAGTLRFHSAPKLQPPAVVVTSDPDTSSGDIFLSPLDSGKGGPMILNYQGRLVWYYPAPFGGAYNLEVQTYLGQPVLTWWPQTSNLRGEDVIVNTSYKTVAVLHAGSSDYTDPHDFQLTPQGTAWVMAQTLVPANLTIVGGPSQGMVWDFLIQELDEKSCGNGMPTVTSL